MMIAQNPLISAMKDILHNLEMFLSDANYDKDQFKENMYYLYVKSAEEPVNEDDLNSFIDIIVK